MENRSPNSTVKGVINIKELSEESQDKKN